MSIEANSTVIEFLNAAFNEFAIIDRRHSTLQRKDYISFLLYIKGIE